MQTRNVWSRASLVAALLLAVGPVARAANVSITEYYNILEGHTYSVSNNSNLSGPPVGIFGFAVSNNFSSTAFTDRSGWVADVVSAEEWDAGYEVTLSTPGPTLVLFTTDTLGSFQSLFGNDDHVNMYWAGIYYGSNIAPGETSAQFHWDISIASEFVAFTDAGEVIASGSVNAGVPDHGSSLLLVTLGLLGLVTYRGRMARRN